MAAPPKAILNEFLAALRSNGTGYLIPEGTGSGHCVYRKGPQRAIALSGSETAIVFVMFETFDGESSAGSGNNWWQNWGIKVALLIPDDPASPEDCEDSRLDILEDFCAFVHAHRTLYGNTKVGHITAGKFEFVMFSADSPQVFRAVEVTVQYKTLRGA